MTYPTPSDSPLVVILCPDWQPAQVIASICAQLGQEIPVNNDGRIFRVGCIFANEKAHLVELTNGCHILVSTPNSLLRMLEGRMTSLERCSHLIFERADDLFEKFSNQVGKIMSKLQRQNQIIVSSDEWSKDIKDFVKEFLFSEKFVGPQIVFGNPLEALIYSKMKLKIHVIKNQKEDFLRKFIQTDKR